MSGSGHVHWWRAMLHLVRRKAAMHGLHRRSHTWLLPSVSRVVLRHHLRGSVRHLLLLIAMLVHSGDSLRALQVLRRDGVHIVLTRLSFRSWLLVRSSPVVVQVFGTVFARLAQLLVEFGGLTSLRENLVRTAWLASVDVSWSVDLLPRTKNIPSHASQSQVFARDVYHR